MKYLISHQEQEAGPFTLDEIVSKVRNKELELFDYIFDESQQDWVLLMEHADLAKKLKGNKPARPPQQTPTEAKATAAVRAETAVEPTPIARPTTHTTSVHTITEWYVLKGESKLGPFSFTDVIKMLQQKIVFPFDFIWHAGMSGWQRVAEIEEFSPEAVRKAFKSDKDGAFFERKFKRKEINHRVIIHDNNKVWHGSANEISRGGIGLTMTNAMVVPGQEVFVHFNGGGEIPAFNAICEVVSKKFVNDDQPIQYGLRFVKLTPEAQEGLNKKVA